MTGASATEDKISCGIEGYHTVTRDRNLIYTDRTKKVIKHLIKESLNLLEQETGHQSVFCEVQNTLKTCNTFRNMVFLRL